ncbi:MAG TPA: C25 family cysteine peptidase [Candidatus Cloacimonas sp.]|nr:C25 family cysteine peptidase [Candidatus Cloacimonas sp.]HPS59935.1 C25 family cysteine peptidase [Candidatus Cloacimonas sp.]
MKKLAALLISMLLISVVLSAEVITTGNGKNSVTIVNDNADETILQFQIGEFEKNRVFIEGEDWFQILLPKEGITQEKGYPELPVFNRSIIIPEQALMAMEVFDIEYKDFQIKVAPSKGVITRNIEPTSVPYIFKDIYRENSFYPQTIADLSEPYILRDFRGITVLTNPFAYNPVTGTLRVYTAFKVRIYPEGIDTVNTLNRSRASLSRSFYSLYENQFLNWNSYRYTPVDDSYGKLLVICHTNFLSQIAPYINWKRQKGIDTELVEFSTIGTTANQLKTYIQNRYNADNSLTFVQLVGDAPQIPTLSYSGGGSDPGFSLVAGSDNYPDIFIGRFSAQTAAEVTAQVNKTILYERDLNTSATWLSKAMGIASAEGSGGQGDNQESDITHTNLIRTDLLNYGYTSVDQIYDPGASASTVTTNVNNGRGFINYVGHGADTYWVTTNFNNTNALALTNGNKVPFIMDVACVNGNFVSQTCFAEAWMRNANGGAVGIYASSINQSWASPMRAQDEVTDLLIAETHTTLGGLYYNGSCKMMDVYSSDGVNMFRTWHIFGDASLQIRSKTPIAMAVSYPSTIGIGTNSVSVSTGVAGALVALTYNNTIYGKAFTNSNGIATVNITNPPTGEMAYTLTVTAFNRVTYTGTLSQINTATPSQPRFVAEWEPAKGSIIRYPVGLPYTMIADLSNNGLLYVVVSSSSQATCNSAFSTNGINMANVRYIITNNDSYWIRDYGPWTIMDGDNNLQLIDFTYNRQRPNDDLVPTAVANFLGVTLYKMNITHTGGNIMTDGQGKAISTNLVLTENASLSQDAINTMFSNYLGVSDYQLYPDPNNNYINHIDCWAKLLDVDKVIIRSVPTNHSQYSAIEAVVAQWQTKLSSYGTPYKIYRVSTPNDEPYTNSFIFNKHIYVPQMGAASDAAALLAYQNAMPGYTVTGYSYSDFESTDAIHCRVNTIFDNQMISVKHLPPVPSSVLQTLTFNVNIAHTNALNQSGTYISWKTGKNGIWQNSSLSLQSNGNWLTNLTAPVIGDTLFYWISATDVSNRNVTLPLCASQDPFMLVGAYVPSLSEPQVQLQIQGSDVRISWNVVPYANNYVIYAADTPQGSFLPVGSTSETYWETSLIAEKKFFKIIAQRVVR